MIKGIIFDLDGVLLKTDQFHYLAWGKIAEKFSIPFSYEINDRLRGVSRMDSLNIILSYSKESFSEIEKEEIADEKNEIYRSYLQKMTPKDVDDSVRETLKKLKDIGLKLAIGSSSKNTNLILEKTHLLEYFDAVSDGNNITKSKPNPEVFLKAAEYLNLEPSECFVVEDAVAGIDAGNNGGFITVGIGPASKYEKAKFSINKLSDLLNFFKE